MKTLVIDARMIGEHGHGISKYVEGIAAALGDHDKLTREFLALLKVESIREIKWVFLIRKDCPASSPVRKFETQELDVSCYDPRSWILIPKILKETKADLFFNPTFASFPHLPCPYVQTVHDLNHLKFGSFAQKTYYRTLLKKSILHAKRVLTVSQFVKNEIVAWAKVESWKVMVFYNQIETPREYSADEVQEVLAKWSLQSRRYFFSVSNSKPHKNMSMLLAAYRDYQNRVGPEALPLVATLGPSARAPGVCAVGGLSQKELDILYRNAKAFFFPSLYEGFGRPPVEAGLAGVPAFASDIPPHHEGCQRFGIPMVLLDPERKNLWTKAFEDASIEIHDDV